MCNSHLKGWKSLKNLKVGVFETDFKQVPFVFRQTTCTFSESLRPEENVCDPPKKHSLITQKRFWPFFGVLPGFLGVPQAILVV